MCLHVMNCSETGQSNKANSTYLTRPDHILQNARGYKIGLLFWLPFS